jgi:hypothetical protein
VLCSGTVTRCLGTLTLKAGTGSHASVIGTSHYKLTGGTRANVIVALNRAGRALLARARSLNVTALSTGPGALGTTLTTQHGVRLGSVPSIALSPWTVQFDGVSYTVSTVSGLPATPPATRSTTAGRVVIEVTTQATIAALARWFHAISVGRPTLKTVTITHQGPGQTLTFVLQSAAPVAIAKLFTGSHAPPAYKVTLGYGALL